MCILWDAYVVKCSLRTKILLTIINNQMKKIRFFLVVLATLVSSLAFAQNLTVTGTVKDSSTGEPVPFAAIQIKGTATGGRSVFDQCSC